MPEVEGLYGCWPNAPQPVMVARVKAEAQKVVSIDYTLTDADGTVLDSSEGRAPLAYLHGAKNIVPGLEKAIDGKAVGETIDVTVTPADGYGDYDATAIRNVAVRKLPEKRPEAGMILQVQTPEGPRHVTVQSVRGDYAKVDFNHPLAGKDLHFKVTVKDIREATAEEIEHGHAHSTGGAHDHGEEGAAAEGGAAHASHEGHSHG
jgi:FKBP-type peptidyl-prolyl cis-trans isomerase SlyD